VAVSRFNPDYPDAGLVQIAPSSVAVGSGSGTANGNGTVDFSGVSSVSLNGIFSSGYSNYKIMLNLSSASANSNIQGRFRVSGTDSTTGYYLAHWYIVSGTGTGTVQQDANIAHINFGDYYSTGKTLVEATIHNVFDASSTVYNYHTVMNYNTTGRSFTGGGMHSVATSYDGMTFFTSSGTITGSVSVYGFRK
jgi:hypothetical protein